MRMAVKLKFIFNMKTYKKIIPILTIVSLIGCTSGETLFQRKTYVFDTVVQSKLYDGKETDLDKIDEILNRYDKLCDSYHQRDIANVYTMNRSGEIPVTYSNDFVSMLSDVLTIASEIEYFNPFIGSLSNMWKDALANKQVLSNDVIAEELAKMNNTHISISGDEITKIGEAELDLGGIAKGYALDKVYEYLKDNNEKNYLVDAGSSSILLGEKKTKDGYFNIGPKDLPTKFLKLKNCFVSTSGISEQGVRIDGVTYSHIINPYTGSAINNYDAVIVVSQEGALGDALSTSMVFNTIDEIKELETEFDVQVLVIKNKQIVYINENIELGNR